MSVFRIHKDSNYTVMSNYHFRDKRLSLKAKGLLSQMLSLPKDWDYSKNGLVAINKENISAIDSALTELRSCGYLVITKKNPNETKSGRIEYVYDIYEQPTTIQTKDIQGTENLYLENPAQLNTKDKDTYNKCTYNKYIDEFNELWFDYPKKQGKAQAQKAYIKSRSKGVTVEQVKKGISNYNNYIRHNKIEMRFVKQGSTWFRGECWNDDYGVKKSDASYDIEELMVIK